MHSCATHWGTVMKKLVLSSLAVAALGLCAAGDPAIAADLPVKAPAAASSYYSWTGCYVGGNLGSVFATERWSLAPPSAPIGTGLTRYSTNGLIGGGQAGCDYQVGTFVLGIQGDLSAANASGTGIDLFNAGLTDRSTISSLGSVTGRVGYAWWRLLFYAKGGGAWQRDKYDMFVTATSVSVTQAALTRSGWTVGGGLEYAITDNFNMFFEYDYYDFGNSTSVFVAPPPETVGIRESESVVKVGANWKFHW
jgi:outer membrane immunogenic protein